MKKRKKVFFLIFLLTFLSLLVLLNMYCIKNSRLDDNVISVDELEQIQQNHKEYEQNVDLYYENSIIPYLNEDDFYLLYVENYDDYKKIYTASDFKIKIYNIEDDYIISLVLYNDIYYKKIRLELTNIPIVNITNNNLLFLYGFGNSLTRLKCDYSIRGNSSSTSEKKSYRLKLINFNGQKIKQSLLNMQENDTWILNSMFLDNSYIREKISYDIWNELSSNYNHNLEYVELIVNGNYQGLYYLMEQVSLQTFDGNIKKDLLVSIKNWNTVLGKYSLDDELTNMYNSSEFEIESGLYEDYNTQKNILNSFRKNILNQDYDMMIKYDLNNIINYGLFLNLVMARDNTYKNQKILFRNMNSYYLVQKTVWDLDWSFENENINNYYSDISIDVNDLDYDLAIPDSVRNSVIYKKLSKYMYFIFRIKYYNLENINKLINQYSDYLKIYGATIRDSKKWGNESFVESLDVIKKFIQERIKVLDIYYGGM